MGTEHYHHRSTAVHRLRLGKAWLALPCGRGFSQDNLEVCVLNLYPDTLVPTVLSLALFLFVLQTYGDAGPRRQGLFYMHIPAPPLPRHNHANKFLLDRQHTV